MRNGLYSKYKNTKNTCLALIDMNKTMSNIMAIFDVRATCSQNMSAEIMIVHRTLNLVT